MPISSTATSVFSGMASTAMGIPMSLLWLAGVLLVTKACSSTAATISFVVLLPTEPVTATTFAAASFQFFPGDSPQSNAGVVHIDRGVVPHLAAAQSRRSAPVHSLFDEVVAVPRALKRDKQLPRLHDPGVIGRA